MAAEPDKRSYSSKIPNLKLTQVGAPGISASQVEALVLEIASEVTGHGVDPQDMPEPSRDDLRGLGF